MKIAIDTKSQTLSFTDNGRVGDCDLYSNEAFRIISRIWLKVGWNQKYVYTFTWLGRPVIQLPEDLLRIQEAIYSIKPDLIIETGIAHGGSLVFYASLCNAMGKGRVIGVDLDIRPHNREALENHELFPFMTLISGNSIDPTVVKKVKSLVRPNDVVLVVLDSNHTKQHVLSELQAYGDLIGPGSYIVATDGIMSDLHDVPRGKKEWGGDNPATAAEEYLRKHPEFVMEMPTRLFDESDLSEGVTHWPDAWLKRI